MNVDDVHMTYKTQIPSFVIDRWKYLNKGSKVTFSTDNECIQFLKKEFNQDVSDVFQNIVKGMHKADLWRLCKLYVEGGCYADVDLVPNVTTKQFNKSTFYSCLSAVDDGIFQAFMKIQFRRSPLILLFLVSFLLNRPDQKHHGNAPTMDMYNCLRYNVRNTLRFKSLKAEKEYALQNIKIPITVGSSVANTKVVNLIYFPDIKYTCKFLLIKNSATFEGIIKANKLYVSRTDTKDGWGDDLRVEIVIDEKVSFYLFREVLPMNAMPRAYVEDCGKVIFQSRDPIYFYQHGWKK